MWRLWALCLHDPRGWRQIAYGKWDRCISCLSNPLVRARWDKARLVWDEGSA